MVLVIPGRWAGAVLELPPRGTVAVLKIEIAAARIREVACRENRCAGHFFDQLGSRVGAGEIVAARDVTRANEDRIGSGILVSSSSGRRAVEVKHVRIA